MSINLFFVLILGLLVGMFAYFKPAYTSYGTGEEIPAIELQTFTLYEISRQGIDHVLTGEDGKMFDDRYEISSAIFSDNTKKLAQTVKAQKAVYRNDVVDLSGNVRYERADGLRFFSKEGKYDTNLSVVSTKGAFEIIQNRHRVEGTKLYYNTARDTVSADSVSGVYQLK